MPDALILFGAYLVAVAGMGRLALTLETHWKQTYGATPCPPSLVKRLRVSGAFALGAALMLCLAVDHASMAVLVWIMLLAVAAATIAALLTWQPRVLRLLIRAKQF